MNSFIRQNYKFHWKVWTFYVKDLTPKVHFFIGKNHILSRSVGLLVGSYPGILFSAKLGATVLGRFLGSEEARSRPSVYILVYLLALLLF